jgi:hypothetical protein
MVMEYATRMMTIARERVSALANKMATAEERTKGMATA